MSLTSYDVGSLPFAGDVQKFLEGSTTNSLSSSQSPSPTKYFERKVIEGFLDKIKAGINIPNYPQFRDMSAMFLGAIEGVQKSKGGYVESGLLTVTTEKTQIPEVIVIKKNAREIHEQIGRPFKLKLSVTGPYTLSSLFVRRDTDLFTRLEKVISQIVNDSIFHGKHGSVSLVAVDEPAFGVLDDPLIDYGTEGRENLRRAWDAIFHRASSQGVHTCLHLHDTSDGLFWDVKSLNIVESHVEDFLYTSGKTKKNLESTDKFLKAAICISDFDQLIRGNVTARSTQSPQSFTINERVAEIWKKIIRGQLDPTVYIESIELMKNRLAKILKQATSERVPYVGPECGLISFPTYECALECLRRVVTAIKKHRSP